MCEMDNELKKDVIEIQHDFSKLKSKNDYAKTPPMGWNSYDYYDTTVNEEQIKANADFMAEHLKKFGWEYIVVDIQWYAHGAGSEREEYQYIPFSVLEMDEFGRLQPDPARFPSSADGVGFGPLADYVHNLGLKFGIHIMRGIPRQAAHDHLPVKGTKTTANRVADPFSICGWNPDMYGVKNTPEGQAYYDTLIQMYADWGVDFIKCDDICNTNVFPHRPYSARHEIEMLAKAIEKSGREIVLSLSPGPALIEEAWHYETYANMWRITDDFWDDWKLLKDMFHRCELWQKHVSKGCYPDCDMLPVGMLGKGFGKERPTNFTKDEQRTMLTLWCLFGSPLMIGGELTKLDDWTLSLLTNSKVLELLKTECVPTQIMLDEKCAIWRSDREEWGMTHFAIFNLDDKEATIRLSLKNLKGIPLDRPLRFTELWTGEQVDSVDGILVTHLAPHACALYKRQR